MAKYSTFKYGDGTKYGAGEQTADLRYGLLIAWDGYYGWGNEANRMTSFSTARGRQSMIAAGGDGPEPHRPGTGTIILDNEDGRYDPFNRSSPLYPYVTPGKFFRFKIHSITEDTTHDVMWGIVSDIRPVTEDGKQKVRLELVDGLQWLVERVVNIGLNQALDKDDPPMHILSFSDWPLTRWPVRISVDTTTHAYWWAWAQNAFEATREWNSAEFGVSFHSRDGRYTWRSKDYTHYASFTLEEDEILRGIGRPQPWEIVKNNVRVNVQTKLLDPINTTIWEMSDTPPIAAGETFYVEATFKYQEWQPCGAAVSFNYTVNTQADGGGADLTGSVDLSYNAQIGEGAILSLYNRSGSNGYITLLRAVGNAIYAPYVDMREENDTLSKATYGSKTMSITSRWTEDSQYANNLAAWLLDGLKDPEQLPTIQLEDRFTKQFQPDLYDRIVLVAPSIGIANTYRIGQIEHQSIGESCQGVRTTFRLEKYMNYSLDVGDDTFHGARVFGFDTPQVVPDTTPTFVIFDAVSFYSDATYVSGATNTIIIPAGLDGYHRVKVYVQWPGDNNGVRYIGIYNSTTGKLLASDYRPAIGATPMGQNVQVTHYFDAGDVIKIMCIQSSGGPLTLDYSTFPTYPVLFVEFMGA